MSQECSLFYFQPYLPRVEFCELNKTPYLYALNYFPNLKFKDNLLRLKLYFPFVSVLLNSFNQNHSSCLHLRVTLNRPMNQQFNILPNSTCLISAAFLFCANLAFSQISIEWDRTAGCTQFEELNALIATSDGGYIFGGMTESQDLLPNCEVTGQSRDTTVWPEKRGDFWVVKVDSLGHIEWDGRYGGYNQDRMWSIHETSDGGFILGGESLSGQDSGTEHGQLNRGGFDYWLLKIDSQGNFEKDWTIGGPGDDVLRAVIPYEDGYMLFGYSNSDNNVSSWGEKSDDSRGGDDFWIVRVKSDLTVEKDWTIGGSGQDRLNDAKILPDGNFIISGWSTSPETLPGNVGEKSDPNFGLNDFWIVKIDPQANILWQMTLGGNLEDVANDLTIAQDGSIIVTGFSNSEPSPDNNIGNKTQPLHGKHDAWIVKIKDNGNSGEVVWEKSFGGEDADYAYSSAMTSVGNIMVIGHSNSRDTSSGFGNKFAPLISGMDNWVIYLAQDGTKLWDATVGGLGDDTCNKIINAHEYGFVFAGNSNSMKYDPYKSEDTRGFNDFWVVRTGCNVSPPGLEDFATSCNNDLVVIDATVDSCGFCKYHWDDGVMGPIREFTPQTSIDLQLIVEHPDGCEAKDSIKIDVLPGIETVLSEYTPVTCFGDNDAEFSIEEVVGGSAPYMFSFNEGAWTDFALYTNLAPGEYTLEIVDTNGCTYDTAFLIEQPQEVLVELGSDIEIDFGDSVQLQALTNLLPGAFTFDWGQPHLLSCDDCLTPWVQPFYTTTYNITLKDTSGCEASDNVRVVLEKEKSNVFIPNVFSPNNDNTNDFFTAYADKSVAHIARLLVYDRWGELLFERYNFQPNKGQLGWDGRHAGGFLQSGVFSYLLEIKYIDERTEVFTGDVTLIR